MDTILKLHPHNIAQLKGHIKAKGPSTIHGDGNIYPAMKDWTPDSGKMNHSINNATLSNANREEATYYKTYDTIDEVPDTIEELQDELIAAKFKNAAKARSEQIATTSNTFEAYVEPAKDNSKKIAALKTKLDAAQEKVNAAKPVAEAAGATDKDKKTLETLQSKVDELYAEYNKLSAE